MKNLLLVLALFLSPPVLADEALNLMGAGGVISNSPYTGVKTKTQAVPLLIGEYKGFYIKGIEAGYHFLKNDSFIFSIVAMPCMMGYSSEDSESLNGMEDRLMSVNAGIKAEYALPHEVGVVSAAALTDILSRNNGSQYELSFGKEFKGNIFRFSPSLGVRYQDKSLVNYYYGVNGNEARLGRGAYQARGAFNPFLDLLFVSGVSKRLLIITKLGVESLDCSIQKSPIVDRAYIVSATAGLTYRF